MAAPPKRPHERPSVGNDGRRRDPPRAEIGGERVELAEGVLEGAHDRAVRRGAVPHVDGARGREERGSGGVVVTLARAEELEVERSLPDLGARLVGGGDGGGGREDRAPRDGPLARGPTRGEPALREGKREQEKE